MRLYWLWEHTMQDNIGVIILFGILLMYTIVIIILTRVILRAEWRRDEESRYPERAKALIALRNTEIKKLRRQQEKDEKQIELLEERIRGAKAWAILTHHRFDAALGKVTEILEGLK